MIYVRSPEGRGLVGPGAGNTAGGTIPSGPQPPKTTPGSSPRSIPSTVIPAVIAVVVLVILVCVVLYLLKYMRRTRRGVSLLPTTAPKPDLVEVRLAPKAVLHTADAKWDHIMVCSDAFGSFHMY